MNYKLSIKYIKNITVISKFVYFFKCAAIIQIQLPAFIEQLLNATTY